MTIFQHTVDDVLSGKKTMTRRPVKPGEALQSRDALGLPPCIFGQTATMLRVKWRVGGVYSVQPARGKPSVARIEVLALERDDDVRKISDDDARAEGFETPIDFLLTWTKMHDTPAWSYQDCDLDRRYYGDEFAESWRVHQAPKWLDYLAHRPAARYDAWKITFRLVERVGAR